jgi:hypothetical protein
MLAAELEADVKPGSNRFGDGRVNPQEAGRRGGIASGASRRMRQQRQLEERIVNGKNGQAQAFVLRLRLERDRQLEAERTRLDAWCSALVDDVEAEQRRLAELREERRQAEAELDAAKSDEQVLERLLRDADANGLLERVLERMAFEQREVSE